MEGQMSSRTRHTPANRSESGKHASLAKPCPRPPLPPSCRRRPAHLHGRVISASVSLHRLLGGHRVQGALRLRNRWCIVRSGRKASRAVRAQGGGLVLNVVQPAGAPPALPRQAGRLEAGPAPLSQPAPPAPAHAARIQHPFPWQRGAPVPALRLIKTPLPEWQRAPPAPAAASRAPPAAVPRPRLPGQRRRPPAIQPPPPAPLAAQSPLPGPAVEPGRCRALRKGREIRSD